jgi:hypothetical protein
MAVGLGLGNNVVGGELCHARREPLRVDLDVYVLEQGTNLRRYERAFAIQPCDGTARRFVTNLVPHILLGGGGAEGAVNAQ